jgi:DNA-binding response OmpR family regulator
MLQQRKKVLIVDNDEDVLIALERVLEQEGYETTTAWDLPEGLGLMATTGFDLLLIGDHPPELNCERVLKLLRREDVRVPCVIMHTAARHPFSEQYLRFLGASGVACKWSEEEVTSEIRRCMAPMPVAKLKAMSAAAGRAG